MKRLTWSGVLGAAVLAFAGAVAAQAPPPAADPRPPTQAPQAAAPQAPAPPAAEPQAPAAQTPAPTAKASGEQKLSVTGCLRESSASPAGANQDAAGKADPANGAPKFVLAEAVAAAGAAGSDGSSTTPRTFVLVANDAALTPHVGKKLELTGTVDGSSSASPRLLVESGKVVTGTCAP